MSYNHNPRSVNERRSRRTLSSIHLSIISFMFIFLFYFLVLHSAVYDTLISSISSSILHFNVLLRFPPMKWQNAVRMVEPDEPPDFRFCPVLHRFSGLVSGSEIDRFSCLTGPEFIPVPGSTGRSGPVLTTMILSAKNVSNTEFGWLWINVKRC